MNSLEKQSITGQPFMVYLAIFYYTFQRPIEDPHVPTIPVEPYDPFNGRRNSLIVKVEFRGSKFLPQLDIFNDSQAVCIVEGRASTNDHPTRGWFGPWIVHITGIFDGNRTCDPSQTRLQIVRDSDVNW